ncbi:MAG: pyridoxal-phosphate-dependent aminotransferase family protein [Rhizobiaceae bacterium]
MSLNFGRTLLAIPGPSVIPERVLNAMHQPSPNIYSGALVEMTDTIYPDLQSVARTKEKVAIYISNGHGAWEAALRNTLITGDTVLVLQTGRFGTNWGIMAESHGIRTRVLDFGMQADVNFEQVETELRKDTTGDIRAILVVQTDTASSVRNDIQGLRKVISECGHDALFMVDCIASLGCERFEMDEWGVDVMVTGCQKGLMTPAGLSFVYFNEKAAENQKRVSPGQYWDWVPRTRSELFYQKFCGTAPTHHLFGLREALDMLVHEEGVEAAWRRHETIARAIWAAIESWGSGGELQHNIADQTKRSNAVSAIVTGKGEADKIREWTEKEAGVTFGIPLGFEDEWDNHFRIGHMGHQNIPMVLGALGAIDAAMKAQDIPHGEGALAAASSVLASHGK